MSSKFKQIEQQRGQPMAEILRELFDKHGSQTDVARALGISQPTLSLWLAKLGLEQYTRLRERAR